jgi:hypothetical protein
MHRRIAAATGIVMASVLLSRVLGFFRDWTLAHQMGSNAVTDAYNAAFTLPDFLNYLIAGGSLSVTFIPVFAKYAAENREEEGWRVFSTVITVMGFVLIGLVLVGEVFAPHIVNWIAPGFSPGERARVVFLTRIMLPAQICFYEGSILSAVQYAKGQFVVPSLAPLIYNIGIILGGILLAPRIGITGFAVGVLGGAVAGNFLLQIYGAHRAGASFSPSFDVKHPGFWLFLKLSVPIMLAVSVSFADDWILRYFGSYLQAASITWLTYGKNLMRVPLGLVGQGVSISGAVIFGEKVRGIEWRPEYNLQGTDIFAASHFRVDDRAKRSNRKSSVFAYAHARSGSLRHGPDARVFLDWNVCLGCAVHSGSRVLRHAGYRHAGHRGHVNDRAQRSGLLVAGASYAAPWVGAGQLDRDHRLHHRSICLVEPPHEKSGRRKLSGVLFEDGGRFVGRGDCVLPADSVA